MSKHTCHAYQCEVTVPRVMLMCKRHWFMVSAKTRAAVWSTYTPGQCDNLGLIKTEWHTAANAAIREVRAKESK